MSAKIVWLAGDSHEVSSFFVSEKYIHEKKIQ